MLKKTGYLAIIVVLFAYALVAFRGPQGIPSLMEKRKEIQNLQEQNADLVREISEKRSHIDRLKHNPAEQEKEIRERLKLQRPGDMTFILPEPQKAN